MTTTMTIPRPAPAIDRPAPAPADADRCYAAISLSGRLFLLDAPADATDVFEAGRRTITGAIYRIDLDGGISCWLDGDHQDGSGELNWAATQICTALSSQPFTDPWDAPFVCGPVMFTGTGNTHPVGLADVQLARIVDAYGADEDPEDQDTASPEQPLESEPDQWAL